MPFVPSRDGLCLSFIGHVNVCPFSLSRSPRCSRFVFLVFSSLSYFLALFVWGTRGFRRGGCGWLVSLSIDP